MPEFLKKLLKDATTGLDNQTFDMGRICGAIGFITFIGLAIAAWQRFDPQAFGIGFGALATGIGALLKLKENTEPRP